MHVFEDDHTLQVLVTVTVCGDHGILLSILLHLAYPQSLWTGS